MIQEVVFDRAVEYHDLDTLVGLDDVYDPLELLNHFRTHDVDWRVINRDAPIGRRSPRQANLCGFRSCGYSCHWILLRICKPWKSVERSRQQPHAIADLRPLPASTAALATSTSFSTLLPLTPTAPITVPSESLTGIPPPKLIRPPLLSSTP